MIVAVLFVFFVFIITLTFVGALCDAAARADEKMNELFSERED